MLNSPSPSLNLIIYDVAIATYKTRYYSIANSLLFSFFPFPSPFFALAHKSICKLLTILPIFKGVRNCFAIRFAQFAIHLIPPLKSLDLNNIKAKNTILCCLTYNIGVTKHTILICIYGKQCREFKIIE
jgi:hypothetical protein